MLHSVAPNGERQAMDSLGELAADLFQQHVFLSVIHFLDRTEDPQGHTDLDGLLGQRSRVFREATAAVADTGKEECETDPVIVSDAVADFIDVRPDSLADIRHLVEVRILGRLARRTTNRRCCRPQGRAYGDEDQ